MSQIASDVRFGGGCKLPPILGGVFGCTDREVPGLLGEMANVEAGRVILTLLEEAGHQVDIFPLKK